MHLRIKSQTEKLHLVRDFVSAAARNAGFDEETAGKIMLAVDEACTNIIKHAYNFAPTHEIDIDVDCRGTKFEILLSHNGKSFDPRTVKTPNMREYLRTYRRGGLGMHLMRSLMDEIEYTTLPSGQRSVVRLVKNLPVDARNKTG